MNTYAAGFAQIEINHRFLIAVKRNSTVGAEHEAEQTARALAQVYFRLNSGIAADVYRGIACHPVRSDRLNFFTCHG